MQSDKKNTRVLWDKVWTETELDLLKGEIVNEDTWYSLVWKVSLEYWSEIFNRLAPGKRMLECGAGSAKVSLYMARHGYSCVMLDNSYPGLNVGRINFREANLAGNFVLGNAENMSFKDETFDVVYSGGLLNYFDDLYPFIQEMIRVLKPGGLFAATVITNRRFSCQTLGDTQIFLARIVMQILKGKFRGAIRESKRNFPFYENSIPLREYKKIMKKSGLENVVATGTSPFPAIALPKSLRPFYARFMKGLLPLWKKFDYSNSRFTEIWGAAYSIYGVKKG